MATLDKAVSTEDFTTEPTNVYVEAAKLEAILNALVEHKVESMKNEKSRVLTIHSNNSPKPLISRLRITSTTSSSSLKDRDYSDNSCKSLKYSPKRIGQHQKNGSRHIAKSGPRKCRLSSTYSTIKTNRHNHHHYTQNNTSLEEQDIQEEEVDYLNYNTQFLEKCVSPPSVECDRKCCCTADEKQQQQQQPERDYISLKIDLEDDDESEIMRRMRRKRRRRRKKKLKRLAIATMPVVLDDRMKVIDPDELPQRARWTIVATACLLLFMCLLLVGVTLRMAPIIDDMVRKENEELMKSLNREPSSLSSSTIQQGLHNASSRTVPR